MKSSNVRKMEDYGYSTVNLFNTQIMHPTIRLNKYFEYISKGATQFSEAVKNKAIIL